MRAFSSQRIRFAPLSLALITLGLACFPGTKAPNVAPRGTLAPSFSDNESAPFSGPFGVVFGSPQGELKEASEITLVFNRPVRALELAGEESAPPVVLKPEVKGRFQWVGTSAIQFVPETHLPFATRFTVEVPAGLKALDGSVLEKPYKMEFSTQRPKLVDSSPYRRSQDLMPDTVFDLHFNQPIADADILKAIELSAANKPVVFEVRRPDPQNLKRAQLAPKTALPIHSDILLRVSSSLRGMEGPLNAGEEQLLDFKTYGPLEITDLRCDNDTPHGNCAVDGNISIEFSNSIKFSLLKKSIQIEPKIKEQWPSWMDDDTETRGVVIYGNFTPGKRYRVKINSKELKDEHGQKLKADVEREMAFDDLWPVAEIGLRGSIFEAEAGGSGKGIPVAAVNVREAELVTAPLREEDILSFEENEDAPGRPPSLDGLAGLSGAKRMTLKPNVPVNKPFTHLVRPSDVLGGDKKRGPLAIALGYTERPGTDNARETELRSVAQVTDLAISAKISPYGSVIWVSKLGTAAPVEGASVSIRKAGDQGPAKVFLTDGKGFAFVPADIYKPTGDYREKAVVVAKAGDDWTFRRVDEMLPGYRYGVSVDWYDDGPFGMMFTDRGIYRPGDTVQFKGIVRQEGRGGGTETPSGRTVTITVEGSQGDEISKQTARLSAFGTFASSVLIPRTGKLGSYSIRAHIEGSPRNWADVSENFEVAEYRPASFEVSVESDKPSYVRGDKMQCTGHGDYLFGAPMQNAGVRMNIFRAGGYFEPPDLDEGFVTSAAAYYADLSEEQQEGSEIESASSKLDIKGTAGLGAPLALPGQRGTEFVTCEAEVMDVSRQAIAGSTTAIVHPGEFYIGLKAGSDYFVNAGDTLKPEVLTVDPKGARLGGNSVKIELLQRVWTISRRKSADGSIHTESEPVDKGVGSCTLTSSSNPVSCPLAVPSAGYYILRATAKDKRGNEISAADSMYALGEGATGFKDTDQGKLELVTDKESYSIGDKARILVKSPFKSAEAIVTVERSGVYSRKQMSISGAMPTVEVPITSDLYPNAFVSVMLVRGRSKDAPAAGTKPGQKSADIGAPAFRMGYAALPVDSDNRRLQIELATNKSDYKPGEEVRVSLDVKGPDKKPVRTELALYAVDEGVLSLINYQTPDPIDVFGEARPLRVATLETRKDLARVHNPFSGLGLDKGLDGGGGAASSMTARRDFRSSAYFNPSLVTDSKGHAEAVFQLPDSLTTYRVMAVGAAEDDRFGYADARVTASRPLMARPAFPRFMRAGDTLDAGVVVNSKGLKKASIDVEINAQGLTLNGPAKKTITLEPGLSEEVRFPFSANQVGTAKVRFAVKGGGAEDAVEITRDVAAPMAPETVALYGDTSNEIAEKIGDMSSLRSDVGGLEVNLSSTALVGLDGGFDHLLGYPYGCVEQLTSRLIPLLPLRELAREFKIELPANTDNLIGDTIAKILNAQRPDGGFGLWADSPKPNVWVTAHALWGLNEAQKGGLRVSAHALESAKRFLRGRLEDMHEDPLLFTSAPFILYVLAEMNAPDAAWAAKVFNDRARLPLFSQALLLHAMVLSKNDRKAIDTLSSELEGRLRLDGPVARAVSNAGDEYAVLMDSNTRTSAMMLRGLLAARPAHPMAAKLAMGLLSDRKGGAWRTTQESAWALLALNDYRKVQEKAEPHFVARVFLGEREVFSTAFEGRSLEAGHTEIAAQMLAASAGSALAFDVDGSGRLFYEARLRYAKKQLPDKPIDRGFFVKTTLRPVNPAALDEALEVVPSATVSQFSGGDLVLADVVVVTPSPRHFVVVDAALPAGFEAVDMRLSTTSRNLELDRGRRGYFGGYDDDEMDDEIAAGRAYLPSYYIREVRDDRVLFFIDHMAAGMYRYRYLARATTLGTFVVPPARAEEMYAPEVFGRTPAGRVVIAPK